jgi:hypothetical protein
MRTARPTLAVVAACVLVSCSAHRSATPQNPASSPPTSLGSTATSSLYRPLHFPRVHGRRCPATPGRFRQTPISGAMTVGTGAVRVLIANAGQPRPGFHPASFDGWLALKTHFVSTPAYRGPFLIRARPIGKVGHIRIGSTPAEFGPLLVPAGSGWREQPYFTFVTSPGCYGWQLDGTTFSYDVIVHVLTKYKPGRP